VEFGVLGPVEVRVAGQVTDAGHSKQLAVLAVLLLDMGRAVSLELLIDRVWGEQPPASVRSILYGYVARLRAVIAGAANPDVELTRSRGGYRLLAQPGLLDLNRFRGLAGEAAQADGDERAAAQLREALGLWRGPALAGLDSPWLRAMRDTLDLERAAAVLDLNEVRLRLGQHAALVSELSGQVSACCTADERLTGQLMLALYRCGRQAEALGWFEQARQLLAGELGADPGPELRSLHQRILRSDPSLAAPCQGPARIASMPVPRQLPSGGCAFTGRATELAWLGQLIGAGEAATAVISAIGGTAGVGKTALALHFARQAAGHFPDGQLYVNLRGFAPAVTPATPAEAVRGFLDALGVPPERIPTDVEAQAGLYRSLLAGKRMLIVLDNARDEQQVRPLLPASPASLVLVTSRNQLAGLTATDGARLLSLDLLAHDEAVQLLSARIGASRAAAEPEAIDEIATLCAHLPLALAVAAARAAARPSFPLARLTAELRDTAGRLDALDAGDQAASVRAVFSWSYRQLSPAAVRMFRLLGLHPGPDISVPAAASLSATDEPQARRLLRELARDCLITEHMPDRYAFHDLLRAYAASMTRECDSQSDRDAAIGRVLDHYLHTAAHAAHLLRSGREPVAPAAPSPGTRPELLADYRQALAWFDAEHRVLLAAVTFAAETRSDSHAWQLPRAMMAYLLRRGYVHERVTVMGAALAAATRLDDTLGQAVSLRGLGSAYINAGDYDQARAHLEHCLPMFARLGDRMGEAVAQHNLTYLASALGRSEEGLRHGERALRLYRALGDETGEAEMLSNLAWFHALRGSYQRARAFCEQSLALTGKLGGCHFDFSVWDTLGYAELCLGDLPQAAAHFECALAICREYGNRHDEAGILINVGDARRAAGELPQARQAWQQALDIYDDIQHPGADKVRAKLASMEE